MKVTPSLNGSSSTGISSWGQAKCGTREPSDASFFLAVILAFRIGEQTLGPLGGESVPEGIAPTPSRIRGRYRTPQVCV